MNTLVPLPNVPSVGLPKLPQIVVPGTITGLLPKLPNVSVPKVPTLPKGGTVFPKGSPTRTVTIAGIPGNIYSYLSADGTPQLVPAGSVAAPGFDSSRYFGTSGGSAGSAGGNASLRRELGLQRWRGQRRLGAGLPPAGCEDRLGSGHRQRPAAAVVRRAHFPRDRSRGRARAGCRDRRPRPHVPGLARQPLRALRPRPCPARARDGSLREGQPGHLQLWTAGNPACRRW